MTPATLRTARLTLSVPDSADADAIHRALQDPEIARFTTIPFPYAHREAEAFVARCAAEWADATNPRWALRHEGTLTGVVGLHGLNGSGTGEIGYWATARSRGNGFMTEAVAPVLDWGFDPEGADLHRVEWRAAVGNTASARVARATGFRYEGTLRGALRNGYGERSDGWIAGLLATDPRTPSAWTIQI